MWFRQTANSAYYLMLNKEAKDKLIKKFRVHDKDTGSSQVQIAILSAEIDELAAHLQEHRKDHSSRRGLLGKVNERRKLLKYLQSEDFEAYEKMLKALKLKK